MALDGLRQLLAAVESGVPLDRAVELLTGGEFTSLSDFQNQFTQGTIPGMEDFLTNLLLSGGDSPLGEGQSLLALLAATFDGMGPDLLMDLLAALPVPGTAAAPDPASSGPDAALAEIFRIPVGTPLLNMDEVDYDIDGNPVFCSMEYFADGYFRHAVMRKKL